MYLLDKNKLKIGDIILCRFCTRLCNVIRKKSNSEFSHAMLYFRPYSVLEAASKGVHSENIQRLPFKNPDDAIVLRYNGSIDCIPKVIKIARSIIGTDYSDDEMKRAMTHSSENAIEKNRQFCTRYVAQPFSKLGVDLVANPDYCTPNDILESNSLVRINNVLRKVTEGDLKIIESESGTDLQREVTNTLIGAVESISGKDIQDLNDIDEFLIANPAFDELVCKALNESGYLNLFNRELSVNEWRYDKELFYKKHKMAGMRVYFALQNIEVLVGLTSEYLFMYNSYKFQSDKYGFKYHGILAEHYGNIVSQLQKCKQVSNEVLQETKWRVVK